MPDDSHLDANGFVVLDVDLGAIRAREILNCGLCDADGYRGGTVCQHREHSTAEGRAAAKEILRVALSKGGKS